LDRKIIGHHHLWRGGQYAHLSLFFSNALMALVRQGRLKKLRAFETKEE
jgi:hypothetical protein